MNSSEMRKMLAFEDKNGLQKVKILVVYELKDDATFYKVRLTYLDNVQVLRMTIPVIHYEHTSFLFVPWDWQEQLPEHPDDIEKIKWRATNADGEALIIAGLPVHPLWTSTY